MPPISICSDARSLFELLSTARTRGGEARLAAWLQRRRVSGRLRERHEAIDELRPMLDLRERLAILGDDFRAGVNPEHLARVGERRCQSIPGVAARARIAACRHRRLCSRLVDRDRIHWYRFRLAQWPPRLSSKPPLLFPIFRRVRSIVNGIGEPAHDLELLSQILATLEAQRFRIAAPDRFARARSM